MRLFWPKGNAGETPPPPRRAPGRSLLLPFFAPAGGVVSLCPVVSRGCGVLGASPHGWWGCSALAVLLLPARVLRLPPAPPPPALLILLMLLQSPIMALDECCDWLRGHPRPCIDGRPGQHQDHKATVDREWERRQPVLSCLHGPGQADRLIPGHLSSEVGQKDQKTLKGRTSKVHREMLMGPAPGTPRGFFTGATNSTLPKNNQQRSEMGGGLFHSFFERTNIQSVESIDSKHELMLYVPFSSSLLLAVALTPSHMRTDTLTSRHVAQ